MVQLSKTGTRSSLSLKAGHPPAVKAGGKRVVKKNSEDNGTLEKDSKRADKPNAFLHQVGVVCCRSMTTSSRMQQMGILIAGPLEKLGRDFPETPVSVRHGKVRPSTEKLHMQRCFFIQQPRKC
ncbi:death-associated protein-like 1 homolog isoform X1 [Neoarius graeffei]|uniref:death-associated protein-like 1 homolog isoform X1 n=1 Tax=Neoarius graeffei TaxID=443677 RepID=UPI00298BFC9C|nr:death-associated protein-like 1 homolog isoform X1 [Neoarius graeffei]